MRIKPVLLATTMTLALAACGGGGGAGGDRSGGGSGPATVTIALSSPPNSLDPAQSASAKKRFANTWPA